MVRVNIIICLFVIYANCIMAYFINKSTGSRKQNYLRT